MPPPTTVDPLTWISIRPGSTGAVVVVGATVVAEASVVVAGAAVVAGEVGEGGAVVVGEAVDPQEVRTPTMRRGRSRRIRAAYRPNRPIPTDRRAAEFSRPGP